MSKVEEFGVSFSNTRNAHRGFDLTGPALDPTELEAPVYPIGAGIAKRTAMAYRPAYLNEDDIVLATCHHAHEVARAHGAKEVMLEHLVHALARVLPAAAVLEDRGIHVEALRRESAAVLASEIPVDNTVQLGQLKASRDFNTVMYLAAAGASHRDEKATGVRDVLDALLKYDPRSRAVRLVRKHATGSLEEAADPLSEMRTAMERYTTEMREVRLLAADIKTGQASQGIAVQNAIDLRLSQLERSVSALVGDSSLNNDRYSVAERVRSIAEAVTAQRTDIAALQRMLTEGLPAAQTGTAVVPAAFDERFGALQKTYETQRNDLVRIETAIVDRLKAFEKGLDAQLTATAANVKQLTERLTLVEDLMTGDPLDSSSVHSVLDDHVKAVQKSMDTQRLDMQRIEALVGDRMKAVERMLDGQTRTLVERVGNIQLAGGGGYDPETIERIRSFEELLAGQSDSVGNIHQTLDSELEQIRKALVALGHAQQTLSTAIDEWRLNNSGDLSVISNRLATIEKTAAQPPAPVAPVVVQAPPVAIPAVATPPGIAASNLLDKVDRTLRNRYKPQ
ncbi:MAG: hypothetical protein U1E49_03910 [Hyphomicrobiaceae bacterium]